MLGKSFRAVSEVSNVSGSDLEGDGLGETILAGWNSASGKPVGSVRFLKICKLKGFGPMAIPFRLRDLMLGGFDTFAGEATVPLPEYPRVVHYLGCDLG